MSTGIITIPQNQIEVAKKIDEIVKFAATSTQLVGFEKAYTHATIVNKISELLTPEYMQPIMQLQGKKLGFLTDKDKDGGYAEEKVKNCIIEAVLEGLEVTGNQFNIIAGKKYTTQEGITALLDKIEGLFYDLTFNLPKVDPATSKTSIEIKIEWTYNNITKVKSVVFPVTVNSGMTYDALNGKADRKAKVWLYKQVTKKNIKDGEINDAIIDIEAEVLQSKTNTANTSQPVNQDSYTERQNQTNQQTNPQDSLISEDDINAANGYMLKAKTLEELTARVAKIKSKFPNFPMDKANELRVKLKAAQTQSNQNQTK